MSWKPRLLGTEAHTPRPTFLLWSPFSPWWTQLFPVFPPDYVSPLFPQYSDLPTGPLAFLTLRLLHGLAGSLPKA